MALPAHLLEQFSSRFANDVEPGHSTGLSLGVSNVDAALPEGGLPRGAVIEFAVKGASSLATSLGLAACSTAQQEGRRQVGEAPWCAFVDPSGTLYGPGVLQAGVQLDRLLIVRPRLEALSRVTLRVAESRAFSVIVVDTVGAPGALLDVALGSWPRVVRRLSVAAAESRASVVLITDSEARRPLPLPVAMRVELERPSLHTLSLRVAKEKRGRVSTPRTVAWTRSHLETPEIQEPLSPPVGWRASEL